MSYRVLVLGALLALITVGCSSGESDPEVPYNQVVRPSEAPSGWEVTDLDALQIATPSTWTEAGTDTETEGVAITTWRDAEDPAETGRAGATVRVITGEHKTAEQAAKDLSVSALMLQSGSVEPEEIVWPGAESAYHFEYVATVTALEDQPKYDTQTVVFDLEDGRQVVVTTSIHAESDVSVADQVIGSVALAAGEQD